MSRSADTAAPAWSPAPEIRPIAAVEFEQIRKLARSVSGLELKAGKEELVMARLRTMMQTGGFRSFHDFYRHVLDDRTGEALANMIDALVTNHTSFNREPDHFDFLRYHVLPTLTGTGPIEIWSAACATGEEVWTLIFLLNEAFPGRRIQVTGSDISNKALRTAERAVYPAERCAGLPAGWLKRYFVPEPGPEKAYRVHATYRAQARFERLNLIEPLARLRRYPVIFCRNVMIYFDTSTQEKVVRQLAGCLEPGGYLFVGHAESLTRVTHGLEYVRPAVYRNSALKGGQWNKS